MAAIKQRSNGPRSAGVSVRMTVHVPVERNMAGPFVRFKEFMRSLDDLGVQVSTLEFISQQGAEKDVRDQRAD